MLQGLVSVQPHTTQVPGVLGVTYMRQRRCNRVIFTSFIIDNVSVLIVNQYLPVLWRIISAIMFNWLSPVPHAPKGAVVAVFISAKVWLIAAHVDFVILQ